MKHKRLFSMLLAAGMAFGAAFAFAACDDGDNGNANGTGASQGGGNSDWFYDAIFGPGNSDVDLTPTEGLIYERGELEEDIEVDDITIAAGPYYTVIGIEDTTVTSVVIPDTYNEIRVLLIGDEAFTDCTQLTSIVLGRNALGGEWLSQFSSLTSITVVKGHPYLHSAGNCVIFTEGKLLLRGCETSVIPTDGSVTSIGWHAFAGCSGLKSITIPNSVMSIGGVAFAECSNLTRIDFQGTKAQWEAIEKGNEERNEWNRNTGNYTVYCTDGTILKGE